MLQKMNEMRRNDDAMKNKCSYQKKSNHLDFQDIWQDQSHFFCRA